MDFSHGGHTISTIEKLYVDKENNIWTLGGFSKSLTMPLNLSIDYNDDVNGIAMQFASANGEYTSNYYTFGGDNGDDVLTSAYSTTDGGIVFGGWLSGKNTDVDKDGNIDEMPTINSKPGRSLIRKGGSDGIIVKLNEDLENVEWARYIYGYEYENIYGVIELTDKSLVAVGNFESEDIAITGIKSSLASVQGYMDAFMISIGEVTTLAEVPELQEIEVTNELNKLKITTEIGENSEGTRTGGTITGTPIGDNKNLVEEVKYGYNAEQVIIITPNTSYSIASIEIDGEKITTYTPDSRGIVRLPLFENVVEDHHVKVVFEKDMSGVVVHHYLKTETGEYTTEKVAEDDYVPGKIGDEYTTNPHIDLEEYTLERDINGNYVIPSGAAGTITRTQKEVIYYYEGQLYTLSVEHRLNGTDEILKTEPIKHLSKNSRYTTSPDSTLLAQYDAVPELTKVTPDTANTSGNIKEDTTVTYYYKYKDHNITTNVKEITVTRYNRATNRVEEMHLKGGTISGEGQKPYETVPHGEDSKKPIVVTPDAGYKIKNITVNDNDISYTLNSDKTVTLPQFTNVVEDKEVEVEFEPIEGRVTIHHYILDSTDPVPLDDGTLAIDEEQTGYVGDPYETEPKTNLADDYELVEMPANYKGYYTENTEVIYYYRRHAAILTVHHYVEGTTNKLGEDEEIEVEIGKRYSTQSLQNLPAIYELVEEPSNKEGIMTPEGVTVTYYYRLKMVKLIVHHYLEGTETSVSPDVETKQVIFTRYETSPATDILNIYALKEIPLNHEGILEEDETEVTYYYRYATTQYRINYLEKDTNRMLHVPINTAAEVDENINLQKYILDIKNYRYDSMSKENLTISTNNEENVVNIYYVPQGYIVIRKIDSITKNPLKGAVFGIYSDSEATNEIMRVTTNGMGTAKTELLDAGKYYIKEIQAPMFYQKSNQIKDIEIKSPLDM